PDRVLHLRWQVEEGDQVRDGGAGDAKTCRQLFVSQAEAIEMLLEAEGLFDGVEVGPLDVLDEGGFEDLLVVEVDNTDGDGSEPGLPGSPQTPLAGNQLKGPVSPPDHDRLQDAVILDALAELGHLVVIERAPGLKRIFSDLLQRDLSLHVGLGRG